MVCDNLSSAVEEIYNFPVSVNFVMAATCAIATAGYMFLGILTVFYPKKQHFRLNVAFKMTNPFAKVVQITQISCFETKMLLPSIV